MTVYYLSTFDKTVAIRNVTAKTYTLCENTPKLRKTWKKYHSAIAALEKISKINYLGSLALTLEREEI